MAIEFTTSKTTKDLEQILALQRENHEIALSANEVKSQGFVTVEHDLPLLKRMNAPHQHSIAKSDGEVVGYALVMLKDLAQDIPVLIPLFHKINSIEYNGNPLGETDYFIMGQVCIKKGFRGQGIFPGMYHKLKETMSSNYQYIITEIAQRNTRSLRAHYKVGFKNILEYQTDKEDWVIVLWDWS